MNAHGKRFVREDEPSVDVREHALLDQPELRYWIVFDDAIFRQAPPIVYDWSREQMAETFNTCEAFRRADSLKSLAGDIGVPCEALLETVADFNAGVEKGRDALGRAHLPAPIDKPPFYAIRQQGGSLSSTVGVAVNEKLQVMRPDGKPIPGLYAAGEILGAGQLQGNAFRRRDDGHALHRLRPFARTAGWWSSRAGAIGDMRRRTVIGGLIGGALAGHGKWIGAAMAEGETKVNDGKARYAGVGEKWTGASALAGGKGLRAVPAWRLALPPFGKKRR